MTDSLPTIWKADPHTFAKHQILKAYLQPWSIIMSRQSKKQGVFDKSLLFIDGFAGPGIYEHGEPGSPIHAIKAVLEHTHEFPVPIDFLFIEKDPERCARLKDEIRKYYPQIERSPKISRLPDVIEGDCETIINAEIGKSERGFGPALIFLDQFGYSDVSMGLIRKIMSQQLCEVFSYLNWDHMNRFLGDSDKWPAMSNAFGGNEWKGVLDLPSAKRPSHILTTYKRALMEKGQAGYVSHFAMWNKQDRLIYWLFFCTNNLRGLEVMKRAMWKVDPTGGFRFSDKHNPDQLSFLQDYNDDSLAKELTRCLLNRKMKVFQVKEFVLTETPAYNFKGALRSLEREGRLRAVDPPPGRKKCRFPDEQMTVEFL